MTERLFCPECPRVVKYIAENDNYSCKGCGQTYKRSQLRKTASRTLEFTLICKLVEEDKVFCGAKINIALSRYLNSEYMREQVLNEFVYAIKHFPDKIKRKTENES